MAGAKLIQSTAEGRPHIDRYELVAEIASGGMATVFLARLSGVGGFQRFFAIKRLHPDLATDQDFVKMFLDEARLAAGIHHPNVVPILEVGASEHGYYIVMDYIEGDTLARVLARAAGAGGSIPTAIGLRVVVDMLAGLHAAHELRDESGAPTELVHRDVSPQNVLVGADGISRLTDFGVARAESRLVATRAGQLKGKVAYMSPEQAAGDSLDRRADVFAAGIVLWEVLTGRRLFKASNEAATIARVLNEPIPSPAQFSPSLAGEVVAVCMRALARDPERRYATAACFADALERAAASASRIRVATVRETAEYIDESMGNEIRQQREAVRAWLQRGEAPDHRAPPGSSLSAAAMAVPGARRKLEFGRVTPEEVLRSAPAPARRTALLASLAVLVALCGVGAYLFASGALGSRGVRSTTIPKTTSRRQPRTAPLVGRRDSGSPSSAAAARSAKPAAGEPGLGAEKAGPGATKRPPGGAGPKADRAPTGTPTKRSRSERGRAAAVDSGAEAAKEAPARPASGASGDVDLSNPYR